MTVISIVAFIYNPDEWIIRRVLKALTKLSIPENAEIEYLLVDNNSKNRWELILEREFADFPFQRITEKRQGLTFARQTGFTRSNGDLIVCVDDDNELNRNYLLSLFTLKEQYPEVGVWGPGIIEVEFQKDAPLRFKNFKAYFQEKYIDEVQFGNEKKWMKYYPPGTGMCLTKEVANAYLEFLRIGKMTATDREGKSLSSGGDSQVVYSAILLGKSAGVSPSLKANHLTSKEKTSLSYLKKLQFGIYSCSPVHVEVFPDLKANIQKPRLSEFIKLFLESVIKSRFGFHPHKFFLPIAKDLALIYSYFEINSLPLPWIYDYLIKKLELK